MGSGHQADAIEWRTNTIKCASLLKLKDETPNMAAQAIQDFMAPLRSQSQEDAAQTTNSELYERLLRLCKDAFDFTLTLRGCKDMYRCEFPKADKLDPQESEAHARERRMGGTPGSLGTEEDRIAFSISSTLVKYPGGNLKKRLVLEKAHVVVN
jgi:hypothetical protein